MPLTADQAQANLSQMNHLARPEIPQAALDAAKLNQFYVFNVGPFEHRRELGNEGTFVVQACPEGQPFWGPLVIDSVIYSTTRRSEEELTSVVYDGRNRAEAIVGTGQGVNPENDLRQWGVFWSENKRPTKDELERANTLLDKTLGRLVQEADAMHRAGGLVAQDIDSVYRVAAKRLKLLQAEHQWINQTTATLECPACGSPVKPGKPICPTCGYVVDPERAKELGIGVEDKKGK